MWEVDEAIRQVNENERRDREAFPGPFVEHVERGCVAQSVRNDEEAKRKAEGKPPCLWFEVCRAIEAAFNAQFPDALGDGK